MAYSDEKTTKATPEENKAGPTGDELVSFEEAMRAFGKDNEKKKMKKAKKITLIILSIVLVLLIGGLIISNLGVRIGGNSQIDDYSEFYFYKKDYKPLISFNFGTGYGGPRYKIWFLPGQKEKLLKKIKEDVNVELTEVVAKNNDIFRNYEISEDFKKIYLYYYAYELDILEDEHGLLSDLSISLEEYSYISDLSSRIYSSEKIQLKVSFYHQIVYGYGNTSLDNSLFEFIKVE